MKNWQARQGDVFVRRIDRIPAKAIPVSQTGDIILARGEVTGHAHRITAPLDAVDVLQEAEKIILNVKAPVVITHEEHGSVRLATGLYESYIQREYDALEQERRVLD
jgi:hypothetical protein